MDEISKKDLLANTGISYGQLYRWKREGLIPEEWFIKRSVFTGQETFFPREQMLARIRAILSLKDTSSLEDIRKGLAFSEYHRYTGEVLNLMLQRENAFILGSRDFSLREAGFEAWTVAAGILEAGIQMGVAEEEIGALIEEALALDKDVHQSEGAQAASRIADAAGPVEAAGTKDAADGAGTAGGRLDGGSPAVQVSLVLLHGSFHFVTATASVALAADRALTVGATRQLQVYRDRVYGAGADACQAPTDLGEGIPS